MKIETVKDQKGSYLVNGNTNVPKSEDNRHYKMVLDWIEDGGVVQPEFTDEEIAESIKTKRVTEIEQRLVVIDSLRIRPMSAIIDGTDVPYDREVLTKLNEEASDLRTELKGLLT